MLVQVEMKICFGFRKFAHHVDFTPGAENVKVIGSKSLTLLYSAYALALGYKYSYGPNILLSLEVCCVKIL